MSATKHGHAKRGRRSRTYRSWYNMLQRCLNQSNPRHADYGARGITVCERWRKFENFLADMGEAPSGLTLERLDNRKGYAPGNCCWATYEDQARNRRPSKLSVAIAEEIDRRAKSGEKHRDLAAEFNVHRTTISDVVRRRTWLGTRSRNSAPMER